jgi:hypothetical protein
MKKTICLKPEVPNQTEAIIDVSVKTVEDLYKNFDQNAPDIQKELNQEFVDHIIDSLSETEENEFLIRITLPNIPDEKEIKRVQNSIEKYFSNMKDLENQSIETMLGRSFKLFGLGIVLLFIAIALHRHFSSTEGFIVQILFGGFTIAALVSLWEAVSNILIKWNSHTNNIRLYERVIKAQVIFCH